MSLRKHKDRINYTVMIVSDSPDGGVKPFSIDRKYVSIGAICIALTLASAIALAAYHSVAYKNAKVEAAMATAKVDILTKDNEKLTAENAELNDKIALVSDTLNQKAQTEAEAAATEEERRIPKGFPLAGPAVIVESSENTPKEEQEGKDPIVVFTASAETRIIAAGDGVVASVLADGEFGHIVTIDHGNGYQSIYRDSSKAMVAEGDQVTQGQNIFEMQSANEKFGYQITQDGKFVDPLIMMEVYG